VASGGQHGAEHLVCQAVDVWTGMVHGFIGSAGSLDAADAALRATGAFLAALLA
jgi:hypothetical protein